MPHASPALRLHAVLSLSVALTVAAAPVAATGAAASAAAGARAQPTRAMLDAALGPEQRDAPPAAFRKQGAAPAVPARIATVEGVELLDVSTRTLAIGFHEGAVRSLPLTPVPDVPGNTPAPLVMGSRGRAAGPTTAVDLALPADTAVTAPVSGEVVEANAYALYGASEDFLVTIAPADAPRLRVRMFHLEGPRVTVGDVVVAGETVVAERSRVLAFRSQIDRVTGQRTPHVHVQVDAG